MSIALHAPDWLALFVQFLSLSLLAVGGAITTAPDMHRYLVEDQQWLTQDQFTSSISIVQAAPGPNVLFVALMGWNVGINSAGGINHPWAWAWGLAGVLVTMLGIMLPSTTLTYFAARWAHANRELRAVRAFKQGMAPIVIALLLSTGWLLAKGAVTVNASWHTWALMGLVTLFVWKTQVHLLWLLGAGAALGALGWV